MVFVRLGRVGLRWGILSDDLVILCEQSFLQFVVCCGVVLDVGLAGRGHDGAAVDTLLTANFLLG